MPTLRGAVILALIGPTVANAAYTVVAPNRIECVRTSHASCDGELSLCTGGPLRDRFVIVFDFARQRFSSTWGRGRITQSWDLPDGSHSVLVSAPPASGQIMFSPD